MAFSSRIWFRIGVLNLKQFVISAHRFGIDLGLGVEPERVTCLNFGHTQAKREVLAILMLVEPLAGLDGKIPYRAESR